MATYAVDSERQLMKATGIVEPTPEWEDMPDGRRRPSERQARSEETGMPLWAVEVIYVQTVFGRSSTVTAKVTVGAVDEPKPVGAGTDRVHRPAGRGTDQQGRAGSSSPGQPRVWSRARSRRAGRPRRAARRRPRPHDGLLTMTNEPKVQLHEVGDLVREARRLISEGGSDSEWVAYLRRKSSLLAAPRS